MDAGDWIRLKRIGGMNYFDSEKSVSNPVSSGSVRFEPHTGRRVYTEFGTSKTRVPASLFTDYVASRRADYVVESGGAGNKTLLATRMCDCAFTSNPKKEGICPSCLHRV